MKFVWSLLGETDNGFHSIECGVFDPPNGITYRGQWPSLLLITDYEHRELSTYPLRDQIWEQLNAALDYGGKIKIVPSFPVQISRCPEIPKDATGNDPIRFDTFII